MERKEIICSAYRMTGGNNFYDGMITCSTISEQTKNKKIPRLAWMCQVGDFFIRSGSFTKRRFDE